MTKRRKPAETDSERYQRAKVAQREYSELGAVFEQVRYGYLEVIAMSKPSNVALREQMYLSIQALDKIKSDLLSAASGADMLEYAAAHQEAMNAN